MSAAPWTVDQPQTVRTNTRQAKGSAKVSPKTGTGRLAMTYFVVSFFVFLFSYGFSSLVGHSSLQTATSANRLTQSRIDSAQRDVLVLQDQVAELSSPTQVSRWADRNGMLPPSGLARLEEMNAQNIGEFGSFIE